MNALNYIEGVALFQGLSVKELKQIANLTHEQGIAKEEILISDNEETNDDSRIFFIIEGRVDVVLTVPGSNQKEVIATLKPGDIIYLYGTLGSGKTVFVKGVCLGLGVKEDVTSPSFVIATEYRGVMTVAHIDLYRLQKKEAVGLPVEEYFLHNGVTMIEWADRIDVSTKGIIVKFHIKDNKKRMIEVEDIRD